MRSARAVRRPGWGAVVGGLLAIVVPAGVASADPAEPTDFRSTVVSIEPATEAIAVDIVGGDSFARLTVEPGHEVVIVGYYGEPYVQIRADGTVQQNRRSPTVAQNRERYGQAVAPTEAPADAAAELPEWETIGGGGSFVWHEHRAHWMAGAPPPGARAGDPVADQVIPLVVDGTAVEVRVVTTLLAPPSRAPVVAGAIVGGFAALILLSVGRRQAWLLAAAGAAACGIGWWQYSSLHPATGPSSLGFVLPGIAAACGLVALSFGRSLLSHALVLLGGLQLGAWVFFRREGLVRAVLPTDAPFWLDRAVTALAGVAAAVAVLAGGIALFRLPGPAPAPVPRAKATTAAASSAGRGSVTTWGRRGRTR